MGRIFDRLTHFLENHFDTGQLEQLEDSMVAFRLEDEDDREWGCLAVAAEEAEQAIFYSVLLESAPAEHRDEVMRFVTLANYGMQVGNFELDLADGEVRYKTSIDVEGEELPEGLLRNLVELNLMMMGMYFEGLNAVIAGERSAAEAIAEIEANDD